MKNVDVARAFWDSVRAGDLDGAFSVLHPDVTLREAEGLPYGGTYRGRDGVASLAEKTFAVFEQEFREIEFIDGGDRVVARLDLVWTARATGKSFEVPIVDVYQFRDGLISDLDVYYKDSKAVAAVWAELGLELNPA